MKNTTSFLKLTLQSALVVLLLSFSISIAKAQRSQAAIRMDNWKLVKLTDQKSYLFDLNSKEGENKNVLDKNPKIAAKLEKKLGDWSM